MKKTNFFIQPIIVILITWCSPLVANHMEGLWRNDHLRITLRIEQEEDGFRAKRTDEGFWYHYSTDDKGYYTDQRGNWYELVNDDQLVWNEARSDKRISFTRVDERNYDQWDNNQYIDDNSQNCNGHRYQNGNQYENGSYGDDIANHYSIEGNWYQRNGKSNIQIVAFNGGIRVRSDRNGWERFYGDRSGNRFRDRDGNTITVLNSNNLRFRSQYGKHEILFSRKRGHNNDRHEWKE